MWVSALSYVMEMFTKSGKPQNRHWGLFSLKNMMLSTPLLRAIVHLYFDYSTFQQVPLLQIKGLHVTQFHKNVILKCCTSAVLGLALFQTLGALGGCVLSLSKRMLSLGWGIICTHLLPDTKSQVHRFVWPVTQKQLQSRPMANFAAYSLCFPCISVYKLLAQNTLLCTCAISCVCILTCVFCLFLQLISGEKIMIMKKNP